MPVTALVRIIEEVAPEQIVCAAGVAIATGDGFTMMSTALLILFPHAGVPVAVAII